MYRNKFKSYTQSDVGFLLKYIGEIIFEKKEYSYGYTFTKSQLESKLTIQS